MVFESLVVEILNTFLRDYVNDLDSSKLRLGIWGGDAVLEELEIKESSLSQLGIPFKVKVGQIKRLELKIPWKKLYTQSVGATLDGVYLLLVPAAHIRYDAEKEEKQLQDTRQRELKRIEETKRKAAEQESPTQEKQNTFIEKLITQVIKNLQVKISNIHIRYEDDMTNPSCPLSFGVSLKDLSFHTADENWEPCLLDENTKHFFKLVQLNNLFAYWNVNSLLYSNKSRGEAQQCLHNSVPSSQDVLFHLMTADAKLQMNPRSDVDFSSPKVDLAVNLPAVAIELNRPQYLNILEFTESVYMMARNLPYRKYRPEVRIHTNAPIWWRYAITGILEVDVRRRLHMWSWQHIHRHRKTVKRYRDLYKDKITSNKALGELLKELEDTEGTLDIFNITLARQQAEMEASKAGLRVYRPGMKMEAEESQGWFGWVWKWGGERETRVTQVKTGAFDDLMTPAEKAKLYAAIGYSEDPVNHNLPKDFEDMKVYFHMKTLSVSFKDNNTDRNEIFKMTVGELTTILTQRSGAQAIKLIAKLNMFEVTGLASDRTTPTLLSSRNAATGTLLSIEFETNPLDETADQRLYIESQPLEIIYDAITVNSMSEFFFPPENLQLDQLTNVTLMKLEQFRDRTASGLMYVIKTQKVLDLNVNLLASYVIIPQNGFYDSTQNVMVLDLGDLKVSSQSKKDLPQLSVGSSAIGDIMDRAYDSFDVQLNSLQFLYSKPDGDWKKARKQKQSALHILEPVDLKVVFSRAMVVTDSRMAKFKISGELPLLSLCISDDRIRGVLDLINSIPVPNRKPAPCRPASKREDLVKKDPQKNMTDFLVTFEINEMSIKLCHLSDGREVTVLHLDIEGVGTELKLLTFDMFSYTFVREICLKCPEYVDSQGKEVHLITTLDNMEDDLLTLEYIKADRNGPEFESQHKNTEQLIKVNFSSLDMHLYTEPILNIMNIFKSLPPFSWCMEEGQEEDKRRKKEEPMIAKRHTSNKSTFEDVVNLHIRTELNCLKVFIEGEKARISEISIEGLGSEVLLRKKKMEVLANLKNIVVLDCVKDAIYKNVVSIADKEVFAFHMVNYTDATVGDAYLDMSKVDTSITLTVGSIQVIILNKFISSILAFINNFQQVKPAEKAAIGMFEAELAKHSTRIALNVHFNTPVIFLPHSSSSNVIVAHLGLISIKNHFAKMSSKTHSKIPPVVDKMTVVLNDLRMYRTTHEADQFQGETQLLKPVSMDLSISRNLSSTWYHDIPDIEITGHLKTVTLMQSQADMTLLLITLNEFLSQPSDAGKPSDTVPAPPNKFKNTLKLDFKFDSMTLVLYSPTANEVELLDCHDEQQKLAEFTLETISISLHTYSGSSLKGSFKVANCLLDDKNPRIKMVTPTMMAMHPSAKQNMMMEVNYCEGRDGITLDTVIQDLYLCASMEFLLKVADIFLKATEQGFAPASQPKATNRRGDKKNGTDPTSTNAAGKVVALNINVLVRNPEIVFVADLTRANSPALVMRVTQCELVQKNDAEGLQTTAVIKDLNVVACPFLWDKRKNNVTMVLQPCQVFYQGNQASTSPPAMEVCVNALSIKVSPAIINTVITIIHSVLTPNAETPQELNSPVPLDLWEQRSWKELKLWFLEDEVDENAQYLAPLMPQGESLQVAINSICLTVEAGVGHGTVPMLLAKSSFHADVKNWSTFINFHGQLNLEVNYYNEMVGVWEPFLEPIEEQLEDARPWTLQLQIKKMPVKYTGISSEVDFNVPDFKTVINISSKDHLNITLSKCGLGMLSNLHMAFVEAATQTTECFQKDEAPFVVKNCLGLPVSVLYSEMFSPTDGEGTNRTMELQDGESLNLDYSSTGNDSAIISLSEMDYYIQPTPLGHTSASVMPLIKVGRGMYSVMHSKSGVTRFVVCHIYSVEGNKYIKIHSPFQIINHFSIPFKVFEGSTCLGVSLPNEEFCVPLDSYRSELSLQPVTDEGEGGQAIEFECSEGFSYEEVSKQEPGTRLQRICCHCGEKGGVLMINIVSLRDAVTSKHTGCVGENFDEPYILHLWPSILLRNLLPYMITYKLQNCGDIAPEATLKPGHSAQLHTAVINQSSLTLCLLDYLVQNWSAEYSLLSEQEEFTFIAFKSLSKDNKDGASGGTERKRAELHIAVHVKYDPGQTVVAIYSPYWMENKTGRLLQYKADDIFFKHPLDYDMPLLFSFKPQNILEKNKVRLMISDSELSQEFSLDTVGNYGDIKCKGRYKDYQVGVKIDASSFGLTRCVTFLPFYLLVNRTKHTIWISEQGQENWTQAQPEQPAIPFWPERNTRYLKIKVEGCESPPQTIDFTRPENCLLLHLDKTLGGITVDVNLSEHSTVIHFSDYYDGAAPFLIINHTKDQVLQFYQSSQKKKEQLEPGKAVYYTWTEPTGSRELRWICGSYHHTLKSEGDIWKNMNDDGKLFLISFYEGLQRVVLFTGERQIYKYLCKCERAKLADKEIILSLQDVGVSLVNNTTGQEVSFIGITSSNVLWGYEEVEKSRWKALGGKAVEMLENSYREYKDREPLEKATVELAKNFQVSLTPNDGDMKLLQPFKARLRRTFLPGVKVEYSVSSQQRSYRIQINRIQIQNQLPGAIFPFVFSPVKLPRSVTEDSRPKPLTDICIVTRAAGHSNISRIKYFKVLIQEMDLKLDLGFLNAIRDLFTPENASIATSEQEVELFEKDIEYILSELNHVSAADTSPISLYEYFHISPIKLHLSFSMSTGGENGRKKRNTELFPIQSLNLLLKSIGATLTDVQDVVFKLAFFEMTFQFCTTQQLQREVESHYKKQALKQMYVLVFGLDVLGNPFGLIRGLSKGVKTFFYEPYQGAIQGPEEFVEGMALGVKALVGSAVEGIAGTASRIAGTASRITGAVAKSLADLTMDEKYQQERQSRGGDALLSGVTGIVSGMTGIVSKPIEGAQKNGATGFFKGVVKGLVGAVAKPAGGIIDMFGSTFQGIQRVAEPSKDIESLRPPRFIHDDGVIRPYKEREAIGRQMLQEIVNGRFALYRYFAHAKIDDSNFLMITKRGILFVTKGTRDKPTCEWQYRFDEFTKDPRIINGQCLCIEAEEKGRSILHSKEGGSCKIIKFKNPDMVKWVLVKLEEARKQEPDCNRNEQQTKTEK